MNKLIASAALIAASTALASATTVTVDIVDLLSSYTSGTAVSESNYCSSSTQTSTCGTLGSYNYDPSATEVATVFGTYATSTGIYYGMGTLATGTSNAGYSASVSDGTLTLSLTSRPAYLGSWAALVVSVSDLLAQSDTATVDDITSFSYTFTYSSGSFDFSVFVMTTADDTTSATELTAADGTISVGDAEISEDSLLVFLISEDSTTGGTSYSATLTLTTTIPEPSAFALLAGVGALAFAVSRRRRSRKA